MTNRREIPKNFTIDSARPPYPEYKYFDGAKDYPFRPNATVFDLVNAWWMIESATLAYSDEDFVKPRFQAVGLEAKFIAKNGTECYVAHNDQAVIVAFRGTESRGHNEGSARADFANVVADVKTDAGIKLVESGQGGRVHSGFKEALDQVWNDELAPYLATLATGGRTFWFTGHSLGAALATLAADRYGNVAGLYTFGSPRVGDESFRSDFWVPAYRFLNNDDIVGRVPPPVPYVHVGELKYIDHNGRIHENSRWWEGVVDQVAGLTASFFNADGKLRIGFHGKLPDAIEDHVPILYATHIWNSLPR